ncbi:MAG: winged helix-turn-helix transcriptional regulator [Chloroflexota bacterium]
METSNESIRDLNLLEQIERDPDITQASLASQLGVAVGTVNWHLKRLVSKGYVKVKRAQRKKLRYIITPSGMALRARLTVEYIDRSFQLYRDTRQIVTELLEDVRSAGYAHVRIETLRTGPDDILDIIRLSCLEQNIEVVEEGNAPVLQIRGARVVLVKPEKEKINE